MKEELISVIIPVYNVKDYLKECIDSVIAQTYQQLEIIIIDDGSADGTAELCDLYLNMDTRIKVIHQDNQGISASRNNGIDHAAGDYIGFVDSDDVCHKKQFELL